MKHRMILLLLLSTFLLAHGARINHEQALNHARNFLLQRDGARSRQATSGITVQPKLKLVDLKHATINGEQDYYLFNVGKQEGFVIISGDDTNPVVLGYSDSGELNATSIPENMRAWLNAYAAQLKYMQENGLEHEVYSPSTQAIAPFVKTKWTQGSPYNMMTPSWVQGSSIAKCAVGCLAVAMAQAMSVFRYPASIYNTIPGYVNPTSWKINTGEETTATLESVLAGTKIEWDNIKDEYKGLEQTLIQRQAVANLMLYCGVSVKTNYSLSSGAVSKRAPTAMRNYFGYSQNIVYKERKDFNTEEWENMIYNELAAGRPVILDGMTSTSTILAEGHAFICDGYDGAGMFHINWGWNNGSDGYFLLNALNPPDQGTGGSYSGAGFNYDQAAIVGIAPAGSQEEIPVINPSTPDTPDNPDNPDTPVNPDNPDNPVDPDPGEVYPPIDPKPMEEAPSETELALLVQAMETTRQKALSLTEVTQQYQQALSALKVKATTLKETDDNLMAMLQDLEKKANRDDIDSYYHELIERCIGTMNTQIIPALTETTTEIDDGISYCQTYIDNLNKINSGLNDLKNCVDTVQTRSGFTDLQRQSNEAFASISAMNGMTMMEVVTQEIEFRLRNVEGLQGQMTDFYNQIEPLLQAAIDETDPQGEWEILERLKRKLSAENDSLEELKFKLRLEEEVRKSVAAQHGTLYRNLQGLEEQIGELLDLVNKKEAEFEDVEMILSDLQRADLSATLNKARGAIRESRRIDNDVIHPLFNAMVLLNEDAITSIQNKCEEITLLMQQYPTDALLAEVRLRRKNLEEELANAKKTNTDNRACMADIGVYESDLLVSINTAHEICEWFTSDLQSAVAIAKEVKAQEEEEQRQRELEEARTQLYELAPNVSVDLAALQGDLEASQRKYDNCVKLHENVLDAESEFLTAARNVAKLLTELPSGSKERQAGQEKLNALISYATQDVPSRLSSISHELEESTTEFRTMKAIFENAYSQILEAETYTDIKQLLTRIQGVETSATEMAGKLGKLREELASLSAFIDEEPQRLANTLMRLKELEIEISLAILSVDSVKADDDLQVVESYDATGRRLNNNQQKSGKGFRIIRYSNGSVRKVKN